MKKSLQAPSGAPKTGTAEEFGGSVMRESRIFSPKNSKKRDFLCFFHHFMMNFRKKTKGGLRTCSLSVFRAKRLVFDAFSSPYNEFLQKTFSICAFFFKRRTSRYYRHGFCGFIIFLIKTSCFGSFFALFERFKSDFSLRAPYTPINIRLHF